MQIYKPFKYRNWIKIIFKKILILELKLTNKWKNPIIIYHSHGYVNKMSWSLPRKIILYTYGILFKFNEVLCILLS